MKLPAIPFITKSVSTQYFLALIFESDKISSMLFREQEQTLTILNTYEVKIDLESASVEELVVATDSVVSRVEMNLPENVDLEKTIFAVPYSWVEDGKITTERLSQLKKISVELALTPMGFIISIEAIIAYMQRKEGAPISGIFVEISEKFLTVFIVRSGNIIDVKQGEIVESVEHTVEKLLGRVTKLDVLPSKIVLLHTKESEAVSQKFLSHHWTKELPFMHLPQVAILERGIENQAIISGVASQLNVEIGEANVRPVVVEDEIFEEEVVENTEDNFGFLKDEDILLAPALVALDEKPQKIESDSLAFEEDAPEPIVRHHGVDTIEKEDYEATFEEDEPEQPYEKNKSSGSIVATMLARASSFFTPSTFSRIPKMIGGGKRIGVIVLALVIISALIYFYYAFLLKAQIIVFTDQKAFAEDSLDITLTTKGESSFEDKTIKISTLDEEVVGEEQQETTGQKATGQKATGTLTIFNKTESSKKLEKGTVITSSNKLDFALIDDVTIASTSSFATSFSNTQAKVSAANFGKEYNIPSGTNFTVKGYATSDVFGKNDTAFTGGTKEEIQVVSKKDLQDLENTVTKRLFDKAKSQVQSKISETDGLIPSYLSVEFIEKSFDRKEDEKAKQVKLDATVLYTLGVYRKDELEKFITSSNDFDVPSEFKLSNDDTSITLSDIEQDDDDITGKLSFNAIFKPQLNIAKIPQEITGKSEKEALSILKQTSGISDATILFPFKLPLLPVIMPLRHENIKVELKTQ